MHRFLEYVTRSTRALPRGSKVHPQRRSKRSSGWRGPFPSDHRTFLELMGRQDDAIAGSDDIGTSAAQLTEFYRENAASGDEASSCGSRLTYPETKKASKEALPICAGGRAAWLGVLAEYRTAVLACVI